MTRGSHEHDAGEHARALDTDHPFTRSEALRAGISVKKLRGPTYRRVLHGVYVTAGVPPTPGLRAAAALVGVPPTAWASHTSAARVLGVPVPPSAREHVSVVRPEDRRSRSEVVCHLRPHGLARVVDGVRVSEAPQLFVELSEILDLVDVVVAGDHLVRQRYVTPGELREHCRTSTGPGAVAARRAAEYVRERVDSPMETRLRMLIVLAGLPEPVVNLTVSDARGRPVRRYDLSYPDQRVAVEYDGRHHVERHQQWESDLDRREASDGDGWRMLVMVAKDVYSSPRLTLQRIHRVLRECGVPAVPVRCRDDWRPHFPGRD